MPSPPSQKAQRVSSADGSADERTLYEHTSDDENYDGRPSGDLSEGDHDILESEDEREKLLTRNDGGPGLFGRKGSGVKIGRLKKAEMKERRKGGREESSALMYEMEEGIGASSTSLRSRRSSESDEQRLLAIRSRRKACLSCTCIGISDEDHRHKEPAYGDGYVLTCPSSSYLSSSSPPHTVSRLRRISRLRPR